MKALAIALLFTSVSAFGAVNSTERHLMAKLGQGDTSEVDLAKRVEPKATRAEVKAFAQRMITDHSKAFEKLEQIAHRENVKLVSGMDKEHHKFEAKLAKEKLGAPYDRTYIAEMVKDHKKDREDIEKALKQIHEPQFKAWAQEELKTVEEHLRMAEELEGKVR